MIELTVVVWPMPLRPSQRHDLPPPNRELTAEQDLTHAVRRLDRVDGQHQGVASSPR